MSMRIGNFVYDVSRFKHPGGSVINTMVKGPDGAEGKTYHDATDTFEAFHSRSDRAQRLLKVLPKRPATMDDPDDEADDPLVGDFRSLVDDLKRDGLYDPIWTVQIWRVIEFLLIWLGSMWLMRYNMVLGGIMYGIAIGRNGLLMHDMGHRAFFGNIWLDKIAHTIVFTFSTTGSASYWNNQHNKHHAATQEMHHDTDLHTLPIVAFNKRSADEGINVAWYLRWQWITFLPAQLLLFHYWRFTHGRHAWRTGNWAELGLIAAHYAVSLSLCWTAGFVPWLVYENIGYSIGGFYLATVFSMNHTHRPVVEPWTRRSWVRRACEHTTNVTPTAFCRWVTGYLCYQIEHHMFPNIPHPQLPYVAPRVRALLEKHGEKYDCLDMLPAMRLVLTNLYDVGQYAHQQAKSAKSE